MSSSKTTNKVSNEQIQSNQEVPSNINWHENYIRTKLYAHQDSSVDQSAYDALVVSLLQPSRKNTCLK